ncbi:MAG: hypothetical protein WCI67_06965 [Chloroflexales bacterium]
MAPPFSHYLTVTLERAKINVAALTMASGVAAHTISDILDGRASPRVGEAVRLCRALHAPCGGAFTALTDMRMPEAQEGADALTYGDVATFEALYRQNRDSAVTLLQHLLLGPLAQGRGSPLDPAVVTDLALHEGGVVQVRLAYPPGLSAAALRRSALAPEGVIIAEDVAAYAGRITLPGLATAKVRRARDVLLRLSVASMDLSKLSVLLELDTLLPQRGMFFRMAWQLWSDPPAHVRLFILACRWHDQPRTPWLGQVRAMLGEDGGDWTSAPLGTLSQRRLICLGGNRGRSVHRSRC